MTLDQFMGLFTIHEHVLLNSLRSQTTKNIFKKMGNLGKIVVTPCQVSPVLIFLDIPTRSLELTKNGG